MAAVAALTVAAAGAAHAQQKTDVIFSAGPTGGSWTPMAAAASQVVNKRFPELNVQVEPGAALVNMEKIRSDKADIGWSMTTVMSDAQKGEGQFAGKQTDKGLYVANFYPNVWQLAGAREQRHQERQGFEGSAGGAAVARQHQPGGRLGVSAQGQRHDAERPGREELRAGRRPMPRP